MVPTTCKYLAIKGFPNNSPKNPLDITINSNLSFVVHGYKGLVLKNIGTLLKYLMGWILQNFLVYRFRHGTA